MHTWRGSFSVPNSSTTILLKRDLPGGVGGPLAIAGLIIAIVVALGVLIRCVRCGNGGKSPPNRGRTRHRTGDLGVESNYLVNLRLRVLGGLVVRSSKTSLEDQVVGTRCTIQWSAGVTFMK